MPPFSNSALEIQKFKKRSTLEKNRIRSLGNAIYYKKKEILFQINPSSYKMQA
ncbi:Hypothetical protein Minf_0888 [Methylacidiphilum infernorum V4]|uniref:Uncharacterized protein n=1 Tax=Methylacidiphilum infernorum (isolate V4) TaxID=481448 RepID=B3DUE0_METI4|nr:Hypothetical protein Minf_0888 [Methylacidiphilum infernorum V4]